MIDTTGLERTPATFSLVDKEDSTRETRLVFGIRPVQDGLDAEIFFDPEQSNGFLPEDGEDHLRRAIRGFARLYCDHFADRRDPMIGHSGWGMHFDKGDLRHLYLDTETHDENRFNEKVTIVDRPAEKRILRQCLMTIFDRALAGGPFLTK